MSPCATRLRSAELVQDAVGGGDVQLAVHILAPAGDLESAPGQFLRRLLDWACRRHVPDPAGAIVAEEVAAIQLRVGSAAVDVSADDGATDGVTAAMGVFG